jgi:ERO1-like protein alpha
LEVKDWKGYRNPWMPEENGFEYTYVNLLRNPERYTGYKGDHSARVWRSIYEQKCFDGINDSDVSDEKRVFYRLISGIHSSISAHIVSDYLIDEATRTWGPNLEMFEARLGNPDVKERVENLYFAYLFVLRAVIKAGPTLKEVHYDTGYPKEDLHTKKLIQMLVDNKDLKHSCPVPFDEGRLWKGKGAEKLKRDLQQCFQNITRVMDCVGCEKCKMWGKFQFLGVATSLKILFSSETCTGDTPGDNTLILERNEVIALVNLLERLSASVETVRSLSLRLTEVGSHPQGLGAISDLVSKKSYGYM